MRADGALDHGSLALLAQRDAASELRPLLLRIQVQGFASAQRRDAATVASFETIALGLIPLVPDDAIADAARMLRHVDDTPASVAAALAERSGSREARAEAPRWNALAMAKSEATLDGRTVTELVDEARRWPDLAAALLVRPEPTLFDRAALYRHADTRTRETIRRDLADALATIRAERPAGAAETSRAVMEVAEARDPGRLIDDVASRLGIAADGIEIVSDSGQEIFVFALRALGLEACDVTRALIVCGAPLSRSVGTVFRLTRLALDTPLPVATYLAGPERIVKRPVRTMGGEPARAAGSLRSDGRADPLRSSTRTSHPRRDRDSIGRGDRRS